VGGKIVIDFFSPNDLQTILEIIQKSNGQFSALVPEVRMEELVSGPAEQTPQSGSMPSPASSSWQEEQTATEPEMQTAEMLDDRGQEQKDEEENTDLYNINNFTI
jgi:hypothetical protein